MPTTSCLNCSRQVAYADEAEQVYCIWCGSLIDAAQDSSNDKEDRRPSGTGDPSYRRRKKPLPIGGIAVGIACLVAIFIAMLIFFAAQDKSGRGGTVIGKSNDSSARTKPSAPQAYAQYVESLKAKIPFDIDQFTKAGFKAVDYNKDSNSNTFLVVTVKIDPAVTLTDKVTGKTEQYSQARLTRNTPPQQVFPERMSIEDLGRLSRQAAMNSGYSWQTVEMLR